MFKPAASSDKHAPLLPLLMLAACVLLCAGCSAAAHKMPPLMKVVREIQHPNGLVVGVPEGFDVVQSPTGFVFSPVENRNLELRNPIIASVSLVPGDMPAYSLSKTRSLDGREVLYRVVKSEGGSGGETYYLNVYERVPGGHLKYEQVMQSDVGEPDFALCWTLVNSTKYQQPKNN